MCSELLDLLDQLLGVDLFGLMDFWSLAVMVLGNGQMMLLLLLLGGAVHSLLLLLLAQLAKLLLGVLLVVSVAAIGFDLF